MARPVLRAVTALGVDPRPAGVQALAGQPGGTVRARLGNCRVVYVINDAEVYIVVVRVADRRKVYRSM